MVDGRNASSGVLIIVLIMMNPTYWIKITIIMTILDDD